MIKTTGDQQLVKKINTSIVLQTIRDNGPLSRAKISEMTGLNKTTVSSLVQDLIDHHLIYEIGTGESSGGRKPVMLLFNKNAGFAIGIDLGVNYILAVLTDLEGHIVMEIKEESASIEVETLFKNIRQCVSKLMEQAPKSPYGIVGIGIGVPGITDHDGNVLFAPHLEWKNVPLRSKLEHEFRVPVTVDNEANCGAICELELGQHQHPENMIYVSVGIGIGTGIVLDRQLIRGSSGFAGEMGHMAVESDGKKCPCGSRGCWELYASENTVLESGAKIFHTAGIKPDLHEMVLLARGGNRQAQAIFERVGAYLGIGIASIINTFNPNIVVIGNRICEAEDLLQEPLQNKVAERALPHHREHAQVVFSNKGVYSSSLGAAHLTIQRYFSEMNGYGQPALRF